ncbi:uncharacterized protein Nmag_2838 [Natrialba magadii ATCC 43099]|nr:uncharacterized protein Nmag_2838 [Natrialba magadii ATCC 43099]
MSKVARFTGKVVTLAKSAVGGRGEAAAPHGGGGFADYAVVSLHCLRIYLEKSYRESLDLLSEMPQILAEIGLNAADLPHHSTLVKAFERIAVVRDLITEARREGELVGKMTLAIDETKGHPWTGEIELDIVVPQRESRPTVALGTLAAFPADPDLTRRAVPRRFRPITIAATHRESPPSRSVAVCIDRLLSGMTVRITTQYITNIRRI